MLTRVHHVGLVVSRLEDGLAFWRDTLGLRISKQATVRDQGVRAALLPIGRSEIELLEPLSGEGGVAKFLARRGEGLHHVCFETPDVAAELEAARRWELPLIDQQPRPGLAGTICFLHPKGTCGVLVEFATPPSDEAPHAPPTSGPLPGLALRTIVSRSRDAGAAERLFASKLRLTTEPVAPRPGLTCGAVTAGGVRLVFATPDPRSVGPEAATWAATLEESGEGLAALELEVNDVAAATTALGTLAPTRSGDGLRLDPARCHGVPLTVHAPA